jgi:LysM repeat protein
MVLVSTLALLLVWRPAVVHGQEAEGSIESVGEVALDQTKDSTTAIHVVRAGETLWSLAARYYGDGHQWPVLARRNGMETKGPEALEVGARLVVPGSPQSRRAVAAPVSAAPVSAGTPKVSTSEAHSKLTVAPAATPLSTVRSSPLAVQTAGTPDALAAGVTSTASVTKGRLPTQSGISGTVVTSGTELSRSPDSVVAVADLSVSPPNDSLSVTVGTRIGLVDLADQEAARKSTELETVFHRDMPDAAEAERRTRAVLRPNVPASRQAEFDAAPFVLSQADLRKAGAITARVGSPGSTDAAYPQRANLTDLIEVRPPMGVKYTVGQRLVAVTSPTALDKRSVIAMPAGIVEIVRVESGKPVLAVLRRQSGRVEQGQRLLPATGTAAPWMTAERLTASDVQTHVRWIDTHELQPTLQSFVLLGAGVAEGVQAGDEFGLFWRSTKKRPSQERLVATVRVVRSEAAGSSAVITRQYQSDIGSGLAARRIAKAP